MSRQHLVVFSGVLCIPHQTPLERKLSDTHSGRPPCMEIVMQRALLDWSLVSSSISASSTEPRGVFRVQGMLLAFTPKQHAAMFLRPYGPSGRLVLEFVVDGIDNLKIVATLENTGDEALKLLNDPRGPLSKMPTDTFLVEHENTGATPAFTGVKVKYVPSVAAQVGKEDAFTVLAPGESVAVEHDLSAAYNFTQAGTGKYSFAAVNRFHYVDPATGAPVELYAEHPEAHTAIVDGKLAVARPTGLTKRATYTGCSSSEQSSLVSAASAAQSYAASALSYTTAHTSSTTRFTTWFGTFSTAHHTTIQTHYSNLNGNTYSSYHFDCTCTDSGTYAYVYPDDFGHVYLCGAFWQAPTTGTDSKGGTLIHESSHFTQNAGTQDYVYGQTDAKSLAKSNPNEAIMNADNHEYYAENNPALS